MENEITHKSIQRVQDALLHYNVNTKIVTFPESTRTAQEAAEAIQCSVAQIAKSIVFCTQNTKQPILVLVSGINRVNEKVLQGLVGEDIKKADADFTRTVTGFVIGGVAPVAHIQNIKTFIDQDLLQYQELWAAAGTSNTVFSITPVDLVRITSGIVVAIQ